MHADCYPRYTWVYSDPNQRPDNHRNPIQELQFNNSGPQTIMLVVEDINGCKDSLTHHVTVYNTNAAMAI